MELLPLGNSIEFRCFRHEVFADLPLLDVAGRLSSGFALRLRCLQQPVVRVCRARRADAALFAGVGCKRRCVGPTVLQAGHVWGCFRCPWGHRNRLILPLKASQVWRRLFWRSALYAILALRGRIWRTNYFRLFGPQRSRGILPPDTRLDRVHDCRRSPRDTLCDRGASLTLVAGKVADACVKAARRGFHTGRRVLRLIGQGARGSPVFERCSRARRRLRGGLGNCRINLRRRGFSIGVNLRATLQPSKPRRERAAGILSPSPWLSKERPGTSCQCGLGWVNCASFSVLLAYVQAAHDTTR